MSNIWNQIKADIYRKEVRTFENAEGGILGSAILAGVAAGVYTDPVAGAQQCLRVAKSFTPRAETGERYSALFELFKELHDRMQVPYDRLAEIIPQD